MKGRGKGEYYKQRYGGGGNKRSVPEELTEEEPGHAPEEDWDNEGWGWAMEACRPSGSASQLEAALWRIDGKQYPAYRDLAGAHNFQCFTLIVDSIQKDPYAPPSRMRVRVPWTTAAFPPDLVSNRIRRVALCDFLTRAFWEQAHGAGIDQAGGGGGWAGPKGGDVNITRPGQHVLQRTSVVVVPGSYVEARCTIALPAAGRRILGDRAVNILCQRLPKVVASSLLYGALPAVKVKEHVDSVEDQAALRDQLSVAGLVAFVADSAILPRASGAADTPMPGRDAVPFRSPPSLERTLAVPHRGAVRGMGIPKGITLIVGGGFNGKSTLLEALAVGVYNHIPGDGRELVCTDPTAIQIRAEDGRRVSAVDISPFINHLPGGKSVTAFTSEDASGSTSQAANIIEALEAGSSALLLDEDTCATNFMIRDEKMQRLVAPEKEPITPFLHRIKSLFTQDGVSTILVMGGSGDYFHVADTVVMMDAYRALDVTARAHAIAREYEAKGQAAPNPLAVSCRSTRKRVPVGPSAAACVGQRVKVRAMDLVQFGDLELDLKGVVQLVDLAQTHAIADAIVLACKSVTSTDRSLTAVLDGLEAAFDDNGQGCGLDALRPRQPPSGHLARPRRQELAAALNRLRALQFTAA